MNNKIRSSILACIIIFLSIFNSNVALAEQTTVDLFNLTSDKDIVVYVSWEKEEPSFVLISPNGTVYDPLVTSNNTGVVRSEKAIFYMIKKASPGQWKITYDKKSNENISISVDEYKEGLWIKDYQLGKIEGTLLPVSFNTEYQKDIVYNYRISAVVNEMGEERVLLEGQDHTNQLVSKTIDLRNISSYGSYKIKLYVYFNDNNTDIFDISFSEPFTYDNPNSPSAIADYDLIVRPEHNQIDVSWGKYLNWSDEGSMITVFEDDNETPVFFNEFDLNDTGISVAYSQTAKIITTELRIKNNGIYSVPYKKQIELNNEKGVISIPDIEVTNISQIALSYSKFENQLTSIQVNNQQNDIFLNDSGDKLIQLDDDWNSIVISYTDDNNVKWEYDRTIFVDKIPPILNIPENYNNINVTDDKLIIVGSVEDCEKLTINNVEITVNEKGGFLYQYNLVNGENTIEIVATDLAGNQTSYISTVNKINNLPTKDKNIIISFLPLIITLSIGIIIIIYGLIFWKRPQQIKSQENLTDNELLNKQQNNDLSKKDEVDNDE